MTTSGAMHAAAAIAVTAVFSVAASSISSPPNLNTNGRPLIAARSQQTRSFVNAEHHIQVLDGLAGGALDEVIDHRHEHTPASRIDPPAHIAEIGVRHVFDFGQRGAHGAYEGRIRVGALVDLRERLLRRLRLQPD